MSAKARYWTTVWIIFGIVVGVILLLELPSWWHHPIGLLFWVVEVVGAIVGGLVFGPVIKLVVDGVLYVYVLIGTRLARLFLGNQAAQADERGETQDSFVHTPLFQVSFVQWYLGYLHFGNDREAVDKSLTPERIAVWIIFGWPLAFAPLVLEETTPILLIVLGLAPVIARHLVRRRGEVENAISRAFSTGLPDSSRAA